MGLVIESVVEKNHNKQESHQWLVCKASVGKFFVGWVGHLRVAKEIHAAQTDPIITIRKIGQRFTHPKRLQHLCLRCKISICSGHEE